jgi:hypothetical protein
MDTLTKLALPNALSYFHAGTKGYRPAGAPHHLALQPKLLHRDTVRRSRYTAWDVSQMVSTC